MSTRQEQERIKRAIARRASPTAGELVRAGTPKPPLYAELSLMERMEAMSTLCRAQWIATGKSLPSYERKNAPGERFVIRRG